MGSVRSAVSFEAADEVRALREALAASERRLTTAIELSSHYYWEQDEHFRFTTFRHPSYHAGLLPAELLGKTPWELEGTPVADGGSWEAHKAVLRAQRPFEDYVVRFTGPDGADLYIAVSGQPLLDGRGQLRGYCGISHDVTKQVQAERYLALERTVGQILDTAEDTTDALVASLRAICESERWDSAQYWCLDEAHAAMALHSGWSIADSAVRRVCEDARGMAFARGMGLVGLAWQTGEPLWVEDFRSDERVLRTDLARRTGWASAFLFPVHSKGRTIGVLDFNARHIPKPDPRLLHVIRGLASQIGNFYERSMALERLRESEELYSGTVELAAIGIGHVDPAGRFVHVNQKLCEMLGYTREELLERSVQQISHPDDLHAADDGRRRLRSGESRAFKIEKRYLRKDGSVVWVAVTAALKRDAAGNALYDISVVEDISDRKRAEERVQFLATHDEMTALPNRAMFRQVLSRAIEAARRRRRRLAVLFVDLDRFKVINDSLGHAAGDQLLKALAGRFKESVRASDVVARLGGDEFVVLVEDVEDPRHVLGVARALLACAIEPVQIAGHECRVTASIGAATFPDDAEDAEALLKAADLAMYTAKEQGKNNCQLYSKQVSTGAVERLAVESHLNDALERGELSLQYQAKVSLSTGRVTGAEALLRWWSRDLGAVSPAQFVPIAEETGLIVPIGQWVLRTACAQNVAWQRQGLPPISIGVNVSPRQFNDAGLLADIEQVLAATGMAPELLELEITEGMIVRDVERAVQKLNALKRMGVRLAIDDFGTGYSSLAQLKRFPIDTLKVDRSFVREIPHDRDDAAIAEAIIAMGRTLDVTVVAEGVETSEQEAFLRSRGCDEMQGFHFSRPCHPDVLAALLRERPAWPLDAALR